MDLGSIFLIVALALLVGLYIARPFFEHRGKVVSREEHDISHLMAERERLITALQELDFDFTLNKIPEDDYPAQRTMLLKKGAEVLRQLDELQQISGEATAEDRIELAIAARRADAGRQAIPAQAREDVSTRTGNGRTPVAVPSGDDLDERIAERRQLKQDKATGFCAQCGNPLQKADIFCSRCGTPR
jgi:hypothetical protein